MVLGGLGGPMNPIPPIKNSWRRPWNSIASILLTVKIGFKLVMSIGNQKIDIPRKCQNQIGIWYFCVKFLGILSIF